MWLFLLLEILILFGFGAAIIMAIKTKNVPVTIIKSDRSDIDVEELAIKIATAVAEKISKEFIEKLGTIGYSASRQSPRIEGLVEMDESVIPISVSVSDISDINLQTHKEEEKMDIDLSEAKDKLTELLKKKREK